MNLSSRLPGICFSILNVDRVKKTNTTCRSGPVIWFFFPRFFSVGVGQALLTTYDTLSLISSSEAFMVPRGWSLLAGQDFLIIQSNISTIMWREDTTCYEDARRSQRM